MAASVMSGSAMSRVGTYRIAYIIADVSAQTTAEPLICDYAGARAANLKKAAVHVDTNDVPMDRRCQ
jgi:hypothetical protein